MRSRAGNSPNNSVVSTEPISGSRKRHVSGPGGIRVPFREIELSATRDGRGGVCLNPSLCVYDTSGPYTDPDHAIDVRDGLPPLRTPWIESRGPFDRMTASYRVVAGHSDPSLLLPTRRTV